MAKRSGVDYRLYLEELEAKKSFTLRVTVCIIAVILLLSAVLTFIAWGSEGFTLWNIPQWFNYWGKGESVQTAPEEETSLKGDIIAANPAAFSRPAARSDENYEIVYEERVVLDKSNRIYGYGENNSSELTDWLNSETYDRYLYSLTFNLGMSSELFCYNVVLKSGYLTVRRFYNSTDMRLMLAVEISDSNYQVQAAVNLLSSSSYKALTISLNLESLTLYCLNSYEEAVGATITTFDSTSSEYVQFNKYIMSGNARVENYEGSSVTVCVDEQLTLYRLEEIRVPIPVEYEHEYLLEEVNTLHNGNSGEDNYSKGKEWLNSIQNYDDYQYRIYFEVKYGQTSVYEFHFTGVNGQKSEFSGGISSNSNGFYGFAQIKDGYDGSIHTVMCECSQTAINGVIFELNTRETPVVNLYFVYEDGNILLMSTGNFNNFEQILYSDDFEFLRSSGDYDGLVYEEMCIFRNQPVGSSVPLPENPIKEGHVFVGWYYDEDLLRPYQNRPIYADTNLYAKFEIERFVVSFDTVGGYEIESMLVDWGTVIDTPNPEKTGYDFKCWLMSDGTEYSGQGIKEDTTLTASWSIKVFTVTFFVDGEVYSVKDVEYGTRLIDVIEEEKNLHVLAVLKDSNEWDIQPYMNTLITEDYDVKAEIRNSNTSDNILRDYPWIFAAAGAALSLIVLITGCFIARRR